MGREHLRCLFQIYSCSNERSNWKHRVRFEDGYCYRQLLNRKDYIVRNTAIKRRRHQELYGAHRKARVWISAYRGYQWKKMLASFSNLKIFEKLWEGQRSEEVGRGRTLEEVGEGWGVRESQRVWRRSEKTEEYRTKSGRLEKIGEVRTIRGSRRRSGKTRNNRRKSRRMKRMYRIDKVREGRRGQRRVRKVKEIWDLWRSKKGLERSKRLPMYVFSFAADSISRLEGYVNIFWLSSFENEGLALFALVGKWADMRLRTVSETAIGSISFFAFSH